MGMESGLSVKSSISASNEKKKNTDLGGSDGGNFLLICVR